MAEREKLEGKREEYKTLRAEILLHTDIIERNIIACLTTTGVALTFGLKESKPSILLLSCVIPIYFWLQHRGHRVGMAKLAAYISVFLENEETGLFWETRLRDQKLRSPVFHAQYRISFFQPTSFFHPYPVLLATSILLTLWQFKALYFPGPLGWQAYVFFLFTAVATATLSKIADVAFDTLTVKWRKAFTDLKSSESAQQDKSRPRFY